MSLIHQVPLQTKIADLEARIYGLEKKVESLEKGERIEHIEMDRGAWDRMWAEFNKFMDSVKIRRKK